MKDRQYPKRFKSHLSLIVQQGKNEQSFILVEDFNAPVLIIDK